MKDAENVGFFLYHNRIVNIYVKMDTLSGYKGFEGI